MYLYDILSLELLGYIPKSSIARLYGIFVFSIVGILRFIHVETSFSSAIC